MTRPAYGRSEDLDERTPPLGPLAPPLVRATSFAVADTEDLRAVADGARPGAYYPRYGHGAARLLESRVAALEGADGAVCFASGMAAFHAVTGAFVRAGEAIAVARTVYGGVEAMCREDLPAAGVDVRRFDPFVPGAAADAVADGPVRLVHVESPVNPTCRVPDVERLADELDGSGALLCVDATFVPPPLQRPLAHGADLSLHSATKFLGGHSDVLAGVVSGRDELMEPLESRRRRTGAMLGPDAAWLVVRSLATLELRARRASDTAARLAAHLDARREDLGIRAVLHPSLPGHPDHDTAARLLETGGSMLTLDLEGGAERAARVHDRLEHVARGVSLGGVESLATIPALTSHVHAPPEERRAAGVTDGMLRVSVGLEPFETLAADLERACS